MRMALIDPSGKLSGIILAEPGDEVPEGFKLIEAPEGVDISWQWTGEAFVPSEEIREEIAAYQFVVEAAAWGDGSAIDIAPYPEDDALSIVYSDDLGTITFRDLAGGAYAVFWDMVPGGDDPMRQAIVAAHDRLFRETDCLIIVGHLDKDNVKAVAVHQELADRMGLKMEDLGDHYRTAWSIARWSLAYGREKAIAEMLAFGQVTKANRLAVL